MNAALLDFDGTLSEHVLIPGEADFHPLWRENGNFTRFARSYDFFSIITGRPLEFITAKIESIDPSLLGTIALSANHGLELLVKGEHSYTTDIDVQAYNELMAEAERAIPDGYLIENKGGLYLAAHYRGHPDTRASEQTIHEILEGFVEKHQNDRLSHSLKLMSGNSVREIGPDGVDKGTVTEKLIRDYCLTDVLVAGDDTTDIDMFRAVRAHAPAHTIIAVRNEGGNPDVSRSAMLTLNGPGELARYLTQR